jgi:hypothetical protein
MSTEIAILAGGCAWGMQQLLRPIPGVVATRGGHSGDAVPNATYRIHGTRAEAIEINFDPGLKFFPDPRLFHKIDSESPNSSTFSTGRFVTAFSALSASLRRCSPLAPRSQIPERIPAT